MYVCIWFTLRHFISIYCILSHSPFHSYCLCCRHIECLWLGFTIIYFWTLAIRIVVFPLPLTELFKLSLYIPIYIAYLHVLLIVFINFFCVNLLLWCLIRTSYLFWSYLLRRNIRFLLFPVCVCDFKYIIYLLLLWVVVTLICCCLTSCCCGNYHPHLLL